MSNTNGVRKRNVQAPEKTIEVVQTSYLLLAADIDHPAWQQARPVPITGYYSGAAAPETRHAEARLLWSSAGLSVRFVCRQAEPLVINAAPQFAGKTINLWERDVCEIFVAPDAAKPEHYF